MEKRAWLMSLLRALWHDAIRTGYAVGIILMLYHAVAALSAEKRGQAVLFGVIFWILLEGLIQKMVNDKLGPVLPLSAKRIEALVNTFPGITILEIGVTLDHVVTVRFCMSGDKNQSEASGKLKAHEIAELMKLKLPLIYEYRAECVDVDSIGTEG